MLAVPSNALWVTLLSKAALLLALSWLALHVQVTSGLFLF
jgi:hypothetical protein